MIEGNEINETENAKCVPINDEIESQDTGLQEEDRSLNSDEDSDETTEGDDGVMEPELPLVQAEPPDDEQNHEKADEILAEFDNQPDDMNDDKFTDINADFLAELNDMTVQPDESLIGEDFMNELENFDPEELSE